MKNVDDLIESANELATQGLSNGEIADELNVSRETASWLVERGGGSTQPTTTEDAEPAGTLSDIHIDWSALGRDSTRLSDVGHAMANLLGDHDDREIDLVVGIEKAGTPLATTVALELGADLATYAPRKHQWEEGDIEDLSGNFSRNFADIRGRECLRHRRHHHQRHDDDRDHRRHHRGGRHAGRLWRAGRQERRRGVGGSAGRIAHAGHPRGPRRGLTCRPSTYPNERTWNELDHRAA